MPGRQPVFLVFAVAPKKNKITFFFPSARFSNPTPHNNNPPPPPPPPPENSRPSPSLRPRKKKNFFFKCEKRTEKLTLELYDLYFLPVQFAHDLRPPMFREGRKLFRQRYFFDLHHRTSLFFSLAGFVANCYSLRNRPHHNHRAGENAIKRFASVGAWRKLATTFPMPPLALAAGQL